MANFLIEKKELSRMTYRPIDIVPLRVSSELSSHSRASSRQDRGEEKWMRDRTTYGDRVSIRESNQRTPIPSLVPWMIRVQESSRISCCSPIPRPLARGQRELRRVRLCTMRSRSRSVDALVRSIRRIKQAIRR